MTDLDISLVESACNSLRNEFSLFGYILTVTPKYFSLGATYREKLALKSQAL